MRRACLVAVCAFLGVAALATSGAQTARAIAPFKKEFDNKYVKKSPETAEEKSLAEAAKTAKCNVCHAGKSKKTRNPYGAALAEILDKKKDAKNVDKIRAALDTVAEHPSDKNNPNSPKYGDLIKQGKLPGGEVAADTGSDDDGDDDGDDK